MGGSWVLANALLGIGGGGEDDLTGGVGFLGLDLAG